MPRETSIQVRVSFEEKDRIEARAKEVGIKPSEFVREVALGYADYKDLEDAGKIPAISEQRRKILTSLLAKNPKKAQRLSQGPLMIR